MSCISFHSEHDTAEVRGWERAYAGGLCTDLLMVALRADLDERYGDNPSPLRRVVSAGYVRQAAPGRFAETLRNHIGGLSDSTFLLGADEPQIFTVALNTAFVMGSDPIRFLARMHGQCEIHAYVEGPNRAWLASILTEGRATDIMRPDSGWEEAITLIQSRDDGPVVMSYSVCEQFPNAQAAAFDYPEDKDGEPDYDAWYDMSHADQWALALAGLRSGTMGSGLEIAPGNWQSYRFGRGVTGFDVRIYADTLAKSTPKSTELRGVDARTGE